MPRRRAVLFPAAAPLVGLFVVPAAAVPVRWRRTVAIASERRNAGAWASPLAASTATLVFGPALPNRSNARTAAGFVGEERVEWPVERCGGKPEEA